MDADGREENVTFFARQNCVKVFGESGVGLQDLVFWVHLDVVIDSAGFGSRKVGRLDGTELLIAVLFFAQSQLWGKCCGC